MTVVLKELCSSKQRACSNSMTCRCSKPGTTGKVAQPSNADQIQQTAEEQGQILEAEVRVLWCSMLPAALLPVNSAQLRQLLAKPLLFESLWGFLSWVFFWFVFFFNEEGKWRPELQQPEKCWTNEGLQKLWHWSESVINYHALKHRIVKVSCLCAGIY